MKKYIKPEVSVETLFTSERIAVGDPYIDGDGTLDSGVTEGTGPEVSISANDWWDLLG